VFSGEKIVVSLSLANINLLKNDWIYLCARDQYIRHFVINLRFILMTVGLNKNYYLILSDCRMIQLTIVEL